MSKVGIVGAGLIGRAWANVFARAGWSVRVRDPDLKQRADIRLASRTGSSREKPRRCRVAAEKRRSTLVALAYPRARGLNDPPKGGLKLFEKYGGGGSDYGTLNDLSAN